MPRHWATAVTHRLTQASSSLIAATWCSAGQASLARSANSRAVHYTARPCPPSPSPPPPPERAAHSAGSCSNTDIIRRGSGVMKRRREGPRVWTSTCTHWSSDIHWVDAGQLHFSLRDSYTTRRTQFPPSSGPPSDTHTLATRSFVAMPQGAVGSLSGCESYLIIRCFSQSKHLECYDAVKRIENKNQIIPKCAFGIGFALRTSNSPWKTCGPLLSHLCYL